MCVWRAHTPGGGSSARTHTGGARTHTPGGGGDEVVLGALAEGQVDGRAAAGVKSGGDAV